MFKKLIVVFLAVVSVLVVGCSLNTKDGSLSKNSNSENILILVNKDNPLPKSFKVDDLVNLSDMVLVNYELERPDIKISKVVYENMNEMFQKAYEDGVYGFVITSGYRTRKEQEKISSEINDGTSAKVNESEHQTGLAFDVKSMDSIVFGSTKQFLWLYENCAEFGFILRYPAGKEEVTGYPYESWHYRYVGRENAINIMGNDITLEEYVNN